jgi:hypothetical protein
MALPEHHHGVGGVSRYFASAKVAAVCLRVLHDLAHVRALALSTVFGRRLRTRLSHVF